MSEPFSLVFFSPITPEKFKATERMMPKAMAGFSDWDRLGYEFVQTDYAEADRISNASPRSYLRELRNSARNELGWRFQYDPDKQYLTCVCLLWTDSWPEILGGVNLLRQCLTAASDGRAGYIVVQDVVFGQKGTAAVVLMRGGQSEIAEPDSDGAQKAVAHAVPIVRSVLDAANQIYEAEDTVADADALLTDHFDQFTGAG